MNRTKQHDPLHSQLSFDDAVIELEAAVYAHARSLQSESE